ncbi:MAG: hypothetical protein P8M07_04270, partial [Flavobacteriales bacterium]|nr:hypothetical protein [Flavobacteriales bacterium]
VPLPDEDEALTLSLVLTAADYSVSLIIPDLNIPDCPGGGTIDIPCIAQADFIYFDYGNCDLVALTYTGTPGILSWTINGNPAGGGNSISSNLGEGVHFICVTVTDFNDPECTSTHCQEVVIICSNGGGDCPYGFTHESMASGAVAIPGAGIVVATEDDIDLSFESITYLDGSTNFGSASIGAPLVGAGDGKVLYLNNIMALYDLSSYDFVDGVEFEFHDAGGLENLRINGALYVGDITGAPAALGGTNVSVVSVDYGWYIAGVVTIVGPVGDLSIAGQEFYVDNICVAGYPGDPNGNGGDCNLNCDNVTDFDSDYSGDSWGDPAAGATIAVAPYDLAFTSGDVDVYAIPTLHASIAACGDPLYQYMTIETAGDFGFGRVLRLHNIGARFDIQSAVPVTDTVCVAYRYAGNLRGFTLNGVMSCSSYPSMSGIHNTVIQGCLIQVNEVLETSANGSVVAASGVLTIIGDVNDIEFRGDEVWVDDICISASDCVDSDEDGICDEDEQAGCTDPTASNYDPNATDDDGSCDYDEVPGCTDPDAPNYNPDATDDDGSCIPGEWNDETENVTCPAECDYVVDFESQALGMVWENPGTPVGAYMFTENGIDIFSHDLNSTLYGAYYNKNEIMLSPRAGFGLNHVMMTNNAGITLELDDFPTDTVCFEFLDMGGFETLEINGVNFSSVNGYGRLQAAPVVIGGIGVKVTGTPIVQITSSGVQQIGFQGKVELYGDVDKLTIAGQELWVDNFCLSSGQESVAGCTYPDAPNYDPNATVEDGSCEYPVDSCVGDLDGNGEIVVNDLLMLLSVFATECE